jgi:hypothetical protein
LSSGEFEETAREAAGEHGIPTAEGVEPYDDKSQRARGEKRKARFRAH